jgi:ribosomal protein L34E
MRRLMLIQSSTVTITIDCPITESMVKSIPTSKDAHVSLSVNNKNPSKIYNFSEMQNCVGKLLKRVFNCIVTLNQD